MSATPRGSFARAQALVEFVCRIGARAGQNVRPQTLRLAQAATVLLLSGFAAIEIWLGEMPHALALLVGAAVLALAALRPPRSGGAALPEDGAGHGEMAQSEIILQLAAQQADDRAVPSSVSTEAWGDLMARVSHDLRTPLNAVIGFSDVMGSELFGPVGDQRYREYIAHIRDSGRELLKSAEDTLAITSLLGGRKPAGGEALNLETIVLEGLRAAGLGDTEAGGVAVDVDARLDVIGDRRGVRQALVNLVSEARIRARTGAPVRLTASGEEEFVVVQIAVSCDAPTRSAAEASLHICMARVLLELQGARLVEFVRHGEWRAVTVLSRAAQPDFFGSAPAAMAWRPRPAHHHVSLVS